MFSKLKSIFGIGKPKAFLVDDEILLTGSSKYQSVNLETHPQCPRYVAFKTSCAHFSNDNRGLFTVEASSLLQWLIERNRNGNFEWTFREWLSNADAGNDDTYTLSDNTAFQLNLEFMIDDALEHNHAIKAYCLACETERTNDEMKLVQESSGGWVYRFVDCKCSNRLASYEVMHFMFKAGASIPKPVSNVVKDFKGAQYMSKQNQNDDRPRKLTPEEMDALREEMKESAEHMLEFWRRNPRTARFRKKLAEKEKSGN